MGAMLPNQPTTEPLELTIGDSWQWIRTLPDYPAAADCVLSYYLRGPSVIDITAGRTGTDHVISIPPATTAAYQPGEYAIQGYITLGTDRVTIYSATIRLKPNLLTAAAGYDGRSHVKRVLDAIENIIEGRAAAGDQEIVIDGTRLIKMTATELLELRFKYKSEYRRELAAARAAQGKNSGRKIVTRFTR